MNRQGQRLYRLDGIEIDTSRFCLRRDGEERHLRQQTFQVLVYLLEQRERLVTKNELIDCVWGETAVTDNALEQCLAEIRKVHGDDSRNPRFIKTVPRARRQKSQTNTVLPDGRYNWTTLARSSDLTGLLML